MNKDNLKTEANKWRAWYYQGQRYWSLAHHLVLFGSIISSLTAGAMLQIHKSGNHGVATILTSLAAALTGIASSGGFERKWRSNRLSRSRVDRLLIDLEGDSPNLSSLAADLKDVIAKHDLEIVAEKKTQKHDIRNA